MGAEALQRVFKTFADPTRVRILALLQREELAVQELMDVLGMAQSRVSRHLAILREAGLIQDRRDGTFVFYRFSVPGEGAWRDAWNVVVRNLRGDLATERDVASLGEVLGARAARTRSFFDAVGPEWDAVRKVFNDEALRARAVSHLIDPGMTVVDVGTGTGILAGELAQLGLRVIAIDNSRRMLEAAAANIERLGLQGIELRQGEAGELPIADSEADAALAHMVLQHLPSPSEAIREMSRVVRPGGAIVVVDFIQHEYEWMRQELGVSWLGFSPEEVHNWFDEANLSHFQLDVREPRSSGRDLPATFIAAAKRPADPT